MGFQALADACITIIAKCAPFTKAAEFFNPRLTGAGALLHELYEFHEALKHTGRDGVLEAAGALIRLDRIDTQNVLKKMQQFCMAQRNVTGDFLAGSSQRDNIVRGIIDVAPLSQQFQGSAYRRRLDLQAGNNVLTRAALFCSTMVSMASR